ncbi:MAG: Radial spoke head protein 4 A [Marteilia pararefringens]
MQKSRCGLVLIKSQLWPGAYTVARNGGKYFRNVYIGKGIKYEGGFQHTPPALPRLMIECTKSESITEIQDPSLEEEIIAQRSAQSKNADGSDKDVDSDKDERNTSDESRSSSSE